MRIGSEQCAHGFGCSQRSRTQARPNKRPQTGSVHAGQCDNAQNLSMAARRAVKTNIFIPFRDKLRAIIAQPCPAAMDAELIVSLGPVFRRSYMEISPASECLSGRSTKRSDVMVSWFELFLTSLDFSEIPALQPPNIRVEKNRGRFFNRPLEHFE